ncbi:UDP-N-acetylglucosamine 2-epimerase (non-hydrolyzing) [Gammaproteobacteria bacterium]|nr:UDP-N-acetylglucosamine 2-epimerase (non-hydrolyzing) [Gammaproteobacteria bacterium]
MKKILMVFGTRPEAIKMAPLYNEIKKNSDSLDLTLCVTAQHREMLDQVLDSFKISPDIDLNIMKKGQDLFDVTSKILLKIRDVIENIRPDLILVHGDTSTAFATSIAAFYSHTPIGHVEAGLRTRNIYSPFPEEFNRQVIGKISKLHFTPTQISKNNLINEFVDDFKIHITGNTVIDSMFYMLNSIEKSKEKKDKITSILNKHIKFKWLEKKYILITGHRRENFGQGFLNICKSIKNLATKHPDIYFVYPVHLNPNVKKPVNEILSDKKNVILIPPLEYEPFLFLLKNCYLVLTDSGGIQEEAPSLGKPVLVMRDETERPEAISAGTVKLVGSDEKTIVQTVNELIESTEKYNEMANASNPFGDGTASLKITLIIKEYFNVK